jgi:hypothetical protein
MSKYEAVVNNIDIKTKELKRKTRSSATLSTTNPTWAAQGANTGLQDEKLATNCLYYGTACSGYTVLHKMVNGNYGFGTRQVMINFKILYQH